jgi:ABC-type multidrug transport system ATPase subunit
VTIVLTTHELERARTLCDRAIVLRSGALIYDGTYPPPLAGEGQGGG